LPPRRRHYIGVFAFSFSQPALLDEVDERDLHKIKTFFVSFWAMDLAFDGEGRLGLLGLLLELWVCFIVTQFENPEEEMRNDDWNCI
jgi:hypothetical protein